MDHSHSGKLLYRPVPGPDFAPNLHSNANPPIFLPSTENGEDFGFGCV